MSKRPIEDVVWRLTHREFTILGMLAAGMSNKAIAYEIAVTPRNIQTSVGNIYEKLLIGDGEKCHPRVLATLWYQEHKDEILREFLERGKASLKKEISPSEH